MHHCNHIVRYATCTSRRILLSHVMTAAGGKYFKVYFLGSGEPYSNTLPLVFTLSQSIYFRKARRTDATVKLDLGTNTFITLSFPASVCVLPVSQ